MSERMLVFTSWGAICAAMIAMVIGHEGATNLNWVANEISTYAAQAPHQGWITAGMLLPCVSLTSVSMLVSRHRLLGDSALTHIVPLSAGSAIAGLLTLAIYKEGAPTLAALKNAGMDAVIEESFHDAGLMIFFDSSILMIVLCGGLIMACVAGRRAKVLGLLAVVLGLAAPALMAIPWAGMLGISGPADGLTERASLGSLWLGALLILIAARPRPGAASRRA